ncbi:MULTISPECIES: response regulator transcription factor [Roseiflexus]|jgi:DNA-binding response OmpR family regulator|uniref:Two component transcriptional regulator, winged helix family n=1 Tax=Roseiflexus castenholzii (strain DSM 13941 / HLO8) TaxID=383372 RepID=A7NS29_ROSCS|nr:MULTISPECIES: response regulator transcription factor [Roseiflexus]ABU60375.1 two component transcriptional regulator, winged helix family [Roseiflexus castenholzii DSM 13941]GIV98756.1 MAG: DNA-binding response regulator [Roseiflexus sp.]
MTTILLVEDDSVLLETLSYNFERAGFQVTTAADGLTGLEMVRQVRPDLIILDVMLPGIDGFSVCRAVAKETAIPIVLLTALHDEAHRIAGLELGAIDYVVKPFSMGELLARVRAILRWNERQRQAPTSNVLSIGPVQLDRNSRRVWYQDREVELSQKEFDLLACLMHNAGVALSRDLLLERVWGNDFLGSNRTIDVHVRWLREKLEPDPANPVLIRTVRGIGYCFQDPSFDPLGRPSRQEHEQTS